MADIQSRKVRRSTPHSSSKFEATSEESIYILHYLQISHGDLKPSNVLVTTGNWIYITDLSPFKPVYIPEDDPADFSFFFDTTSRRSCYLAPERFYGPGSKPESRRPESSWETGGRDNKVTEKMDVFSAGCTIAELWLEGKDVFNLSGMLSWKKGESSPEAVIAEIEEPAIRVSGPRTSLVVQPFSR
jgi:phosphoinositide-3-kinase, regulatory subunit 4